MPRRILILSASVGAGHLRAAQALELALREAAPEAHIQNADVLTFTNALFRRLYGTAYLDLVNKAPHLLGMIYDLTDKPQKTTGRSHALRQLIQKANLSKLHDLLDEPWDIVVNTHFLPADIIARLRRQRKSKLQHVTVVTDFDAHAFWVNQPCDHYYVASDEASLSLRHWGIPANDISITGIPIHPQFAVEKSTHDCRRKHGLSTDRPVLLLLAGGFGVGPIEVMYRALLDISSPAHLVAVCGKNADLKAKLERISTPRHHRTTILGYTTDMDELVAAADAVVTKPGGLTTSEILARGAAMVIVNPIPGQESRNSDFLLENGAAVKINALASMTHKVQQLIENPARLNLLRTNAKSLGHPHAAAKIASAILASLNRPAAH